MFRIFEFCAIKMLKDFFNLNIPIFGEQSRLLERKFKYFMDFDVHIFGRENSHRCFIKKNVFLTKI